MLTLYFVLHHQIALTGIYGIGRTLARRICARLQIHENAPLTALTPQQTTALTAFLSAPSNTPSLGSLALAPPGYRPAFKTNLIDSPQAPSSGPSTSATGAVEPKVAIPRSPTLPTTKDERALMGLGDRLRGLKIETDLRRFVRENIMHHRIVSTRIDEAALSGTNRFPISRSIHMPEEDMLWACLCEGRGRIAMQRLLGG